MPTDLILVRHGESEGNIANRRSRAGDHSAFTPEFRTRHSSTWRLTDNGRAQAEKAGEWLRANGLEVFDWRQVSEYVRAMETAGHLQLSGSAPWFLDYYLRERDWGALDVVSEEERLGQFASDMERREADAFFWTPPRGESLANCSLRVDRVLQTLHRECSDKRAILVCHGEIMWLFRIRLERLTQRRYREIRESGLVHDRILNCQILHYTRTDPETGDVMPFAGWMRSVCPWDLDKSSNGWQKIQRPRFTNADLLTEVERHPQRIF